MTNFTHLAKTTITKVNQFILCNLIASKNLRQQNIKNSSGKADCCAGNTKNSNIVEICHEGHITGLRRHSVSYYICAKR